jgi:hypothetical protein
MGSKEESRIISPEDSVSGTKTVVIGACAPIHPRVGPAVRPDVPIRGGPFFLLVDFGIFSHRHTSGPTSSQLFSASPLRRVYSVSTAAPAGHG